MTDPSHPDSHPDGPDAHLGLDQLADLEEGLLAPAQERAARDHLAGCAICQADVAALASVHQALLGDAEIALPDDVADRLYTALADLPPLAPAVAAATTLPMRLGPSRWQRSRKPVLAALAAAACIALVTVGIIHLPSGGSSSASSAAAPSSAAGPELLHSGHDYTAGTLGSDGAALVRPATSQAAATSGAAAATLAAAAAAPTSGAAAAPTSAAAAPTTGAAAAPAAGVSAAASAAPVASAAGPRSGAAAGTSAAAASAGPTTSAAVPSPAPAATTDALAALRDPAAAQRCVALLLGSTTTPRVLDYATFAGRPAVIAVVDDPNDPTKLSVIAVGPPACSLYSLNRVDKP